MFVNETCGWMGGIEVAVAESARGLRRLGHEVYLAWSQYTHQDPEGFAAIFHGTRPLSDLDRVVAQLQPDVIFVHKVGSVEQIVRLAGLTRLVRMVHDHDVCCPRRHKYTALTGAVCHAPAGWRCWLDAAFLRRTATGLSIFDMPAFFADLRRHALFDVLLVGSRAMAKELAVNGLPQDRIRVLSPAIPGPPHEPTPIAEARHIVYVGQLVRGKGVDLLLQALARLRGPFQATIAGQGNARPRLEAQCRSLGLSDRVTFRDFVSHDEVPSLYASARVVAVPSRWPEPFGLVGPEAMWCARPVVAFAVGGIPDWLDDETTGYLVPPHDVQEFAAALQRLLDDPARAERMGQAGLLRARRDFGFDRYLSDLQAVLSGRPQVKGGVLCGSP
ncbi:MAG: glycosyltransferase family 4 protein [Candidatus Xenobia bacterium]